MGKRRNTKGSGMFVVNLTELNVIPVVESVLWKHFFNMFVCTVRVEIGWLTFWHRSFTFKF